MGFVGIDLGGTQLRVAVADDRGRLRTVVRQPPRAARGREYVIARIVAAVAEALEREGTSPRRIRALGIGLPGPVDPAAGLVISPANLPGFRNVPLNRILTRSIRMSFVRTLFRHTKTNDRFNANEFWLAGRLLRLGDRIFDSTYVIAVFDNRNFPTRCFKTFCNVIRKCE